MPPQVDMFLLIYGGFLVAFCFLVFASFVRQKRLVRALCYIIAFGGIIYEGGCFFAANEAGKATGGAGVDTGKLLAPVWGAFFLAVLWCLLLGWLRPIKRNLNTEKPERDNPQG